MTEPTGKELQYIQVGPSNEREISDSKNAILLKC